MECQREEWLYRNLFTAQPLRETLRTSSPATLSAGLRTTSKDSSSPDQNQTRACGASHSVHTSKSHQTTTDGPSKAAIRSCGLPSGLTGLRLEEQE
ncbi:hypothetical protein SFRURICE_006160 [Spodoptera frugiperda]|nr:hypothetical protein SFRURICE_006160 [Spodoptera frugiperda]